MFIYLYFVLFIDLLQKKKINKTHKIISHDVLY
jgi:hypothetical protein